MTFTPVEIIALVFAVIVALKLIVLSIRPMAWYDSVAKKFLGHNELKTVFSVILGAIILYYLLTELTIVQVFAAFAFVWVLMVIWFQTYSKEIGVFVKKAYQDKNMIKRNWLSLIIWAALVVWVLWVLFT
ncbi:MAG: hypothetical protein WDZ69_00870 [Candidatus Pacearchaeota archaeon]